MSINCQSSSPQSSFCSKSSNVPDMSRFLLVFLSLSLTVSCKNILKMMIMYGTLTGNPSKTLSLSRDGCVSTCLNDKECIAASWKPKDDCQVYGIVLGYQEPDQSISIKKLTASHQNLVAVKTFVPSGTCPTLNTEINGSVTINPRMNNLNLTYNWKKTEEGWTISQCSSIVFSRRANLHLCVKLYRSEQFNKRLTGGSTQPEATRYCGTKGHRFIEKLTESFKRQVVYDISKIWRKKWYIWKYEEQEEIQRKTLNARSSNQLANQPTALDHHLSTVHRGSALNQHVELVRRPPPPRVHRVPIVVEPENLLRVQNGHFIYNLGIAAGFYGGVSAFSLGTAGVVGIQNTFGVIMFGIGLFFGIIALVLLAWPKIKECFENNPRDGTWWDKVFSYLCCADYHPPAPGPAEGAAAQEVPQNPGIIV
ncbi:hypothetical protein CAEBREN_19439 [Caenorhabditis brenneri]|uniref:PAN-3 domain-containing protein n=1 Tax=Caenorhabditis brenneri TaxID=135651 RepID=G0NL90_CAEBE|nr:hypothetical protein CAEBREN_19439 [Caenorhabditis brenneri]